MLTKKTFIENNYKLVFYMNKHYIIKKVILFSNNKEKIFIENFYIVSDKNKYLFKKMLDYFSNKKKEDIKKFLKKIF